MASTDGLELGPQVAQLLRDFQTRTLDGLSSDFERLIYLSSLRDYNTGRYHHYGLETRYSEQAVDEGLRQCHAQVFERLLATPLKEQTEDLISFFESLKVERTRLLDAWQRLRSYQVLPPEESHPLAREMFEKNIQVMLQVLRETDLWALLHDPHRNPHDLP